jgi:competence protein ComEC
MRYLNFPLIKLSLGFLIGLYLGFFYVLSLSTLCVFLFASCILMAMSYHKYHLKPVFLLFSFAFFFFLGALTTFVHLPKNQQSHIIHLPEKDSRLLKNKWDCRRKIKTKYI